MLLYVLAAVAYRESVTIQSLLSCTNLGSTLGDFQSGRDVASIWCALGAMSIFIITPYLKSVREKFKVADLSSVKGITLDQGVLFVMLSGIALYFMNNILPIMTYVGLKMMTK